MEYDRIADFSEAEFDHTEQLIVQRYGQAVELQRVDSELRLDPASEAVTWCPTLYWQARGAHFVVFKVAQGRYRNQFFYTDADQYGTARDDYDDLAHCVLTLLRVQADHERESARASSQANAAKPDEDYDGPAML